MLRLQKTWMLIGLLFLCVTGISAVQAKQKDAQNQGTPLSQIDKQHVLQDNFVLVKTVQALPKAVQSSLRGNNADIGMADAGQPFQESDVLTGKHLPSRRLIFAGVSAGDCLVYNECGGFAYRAEVSLYHLAAGRATLVWRADLQNSRKLFDLPQLRNEIAAGRYYSEMLTLPRATH